MSNFLYKAVCVVCRVLATILVSWLLVNIIQGVVDKPYGVSDAVRIMHDEYATNGVGMAGLVYAANSIFFDLLNIKMLRNKFFRYVKLAAFVLIWIVVVYIQITVGGKITALATTYEGKTAWLFSGLIYAIFITPVLGVLLSVKVSLDEDTDGSAVKNPIIMTIVGILISIAVGFILSLVPGVKPYAHIILPILSNGIGILLIIKSGDVPYMNEGWEWTGGGSSGYSEEYSGGEDYRSEGGLGQLGSAMWKVAKRYNRSYSITFGRMDVTVSQSNYGNTIEFKLNVRLVPNSWCDSEDKVYTLKSSAESELNSIASQIQSDAESALREVQSQYKAYDKNYYVKVTISNVRV